MPRSSASSSLSSRRPAFALPAWVFRAFCLVLLAFPALIASCAQGDPKPVTDSVVTPAATTQPNEPAPTAAPTATTPPQPINPDEAMTPEVTSVSPDKATVGSIGPSIVVAGNNFVPRSIVQLDGAPLATSFVSGTELRATIPTSKLVAVGVLRISVGTSPPGGGASKEVTFDVQNPTATLTSLSPLSVLAGAGPTTLTAAGTGFVPGAKIVYGSTDLTTTFGSSTSLSATIPASLLVSSGTAPITVVNPPPGGGTSSAISFTVANPTAAIQAINPTAAFVGSAALSMSVNGSGFVPGSIVLFNGVTLPTTVVSGSVVTAQVPASSLGAAGDFPVAVSNPPPGGGVTAPVVFRVQYPAPQSTSLAPSSAAVGSGPTDVVVTGLGFFITSQVTFDGAPAATTYQDATHLKATLNAAQLATAGTISVRVVNSAPGGGTSAALPFTVNNGVPSITSLNPGSVVAGSPDRAITITGTGFVATSTARSNGILVMTSYVSPTTLSAVVPANHLLNPGSVAITVTNPAPGGGTSAPKNLTVGCDTSGVDVALGAVGNVTTLATSFAAAPLMSCFSDTGTDSSCAATTLDPNTQRPGRYWVVQNTAGVGVTLSAWAVCTASGQNDDAYLTVYRRPTPPANDQERLACTGQISEGIAWGAGYSSPESGASQWCPGLTKANGGGLTLGVCEKVVVHMQPFSTTSTLYPPPPSLRLKPE
ncbi:MAG: hypothetical protein QOI41_411 [Myxococcales bacterium]|nr:hypothetical protein [Myxococcales bacterium]